MPKAATPAARQRLLDEADNVADAGVQLVAPPDCVTIGLQWNESFSPVARYNMNDERLHIYLNDHLALLTGEIELIRRCRSENSLDPLASFLDAMLPEVEEQQSVVKDILQRTGGSVSALKQAGGWIAEKLGRLKLNDSLTEYSPLSRLLELEGLSLAAITRKMLWENLAATRDHDARLGGIADFRELGEQSGRHLTSLHEHRRAAAPGAL